MASEEVFVTRHAAAADQLDRGQLELGVAGYQDLVSDTTRVLGPVHPLTVQARLGLGRTCHLAGDLERALVLFESVVRYEENRLGTGHPDALAIRIDIAEVLLAADRIEDARESLRATGRTATRDLGPDHALSQQVAAQLTTLSRTERSQPRS